MKILFVAPRFHTNQYQAVRTLQDYKHEVFFHVAAIGTTEDHSLLTPTKFEASSLSLFIERFLGQGGVNRKYYFPKIGNYFSEFRRLSPDVVVIRNPYRFFSVLAAVCALLTKKRIIFYTLEELFRKRSKKLRLKQTITLRLFKAAWMTPILGNEKDGHERLAHMYYVPLPIVIRVGKAEKIEKGNVPRILMVGKYHQERKKHFLLIAALKLLRKKSYDFRVTIVGECVREAQIVKFNEMQDAIDRWGLSNVVELKKNVPFNEMEGLYTSHHLFVLPSVNEPYGVSVTEALGYGLPVICTDSCGAKFNVINGETGYIVKSNSIEDLTDALEALIIDQGKLMIMENKISKFIDSNLSGQAFYNRFSFLIKDRFKLEVSN